MNEMEGKICLVTGANSGIGKATAMGLARKGAHVVMVCRSKNRGEAALIEIKKVSGNDKVDLQIVDLSSPKEIRKFVNVFKAGYPRLDVLINNAGVSLDKREENEEGIEMTLAVNHLACFLMTILLLEKLDFGSTGRIINVASFVHRWVNKVNFDDLEGKQRFIPNQIYAQSKLAILMFTYELARRLEDTGITVNALNPGLVRTNLGYDFTGFWAVFRWFLINTLAISPEKGAETTIYLASSPEVEGITGRYFFKKRPRRSSKASYNQEVWKRLWRVSEEMTGIQYP